MRSRRAKQNGAAGLRSIVSSECHVGQGQTNLGGRTDGAWPRDIVCDLLRTTYCSIPIPTNTHPTNGFDDDGGSEGKLKRPRRPPWNLNHECINTEDC